MRLLWAVVPAGLIAGSLPNLIDDDRLGLHGCMETLPFLLVGAACTFCLGAALRFRARIKATKRSLASLLGSIALGVLLVPFLWHGAVALQSYVLMPLFERSPSKPIELLYICMPACSLAGWDQLYAHHYALLSLTLGPFIALTHESLCRLLEGDGASTSTRMRWTIGFAVAAAFPFLAAASAVVMWQDHLR